jgi:hypothetical protein
MILLQKEETKYRKNLILFFVKWLKYFILNKFLTTKNTKNQNFSTKDADVKFEKH